MSNDRPRVLLADPDMGRRSRLTAALAFAGYHVIEIVSGRALLDTIARHVTQGDWRPVVVVASMSPCDPDVTRTLRALAQSEYAPPIVALGGGARTDDAFGPAMGAVSVVGDGASSNELIGAVDDAFASVPSVPLTMLAQATQPASVRP